MRRKYLIPVNFTMEGYLFGFIKLVNLIEAVIAMLAIGIPLFGFSPFSAKVKVYITILICIPVLILTLHGINDLDILSFLIDVIETKTNARIFAQPNNAEKIRRQRSLENKKHKRLKKQMKEDKKREREEKKMLRKHWRRKNDEEE